MSKWSFSSHLNVNLLLLLLLLLASHRRVSALKHAAGGKPAATAATAPCPRRPETRPRLERREARSGDTPASRSLTCEVASAPPTRWTCLNRQHFFSKEHTSFLQGSLVLSCNFDVLRCSHFPWKKATIKKLNEYFSNILCFHGLLWTRISQRFQAVVDFSGEKKSFKKVTVKYTVLWQYGVKP